MNHRNYVIQDLPLNCTNEVSEIHKPFCDTKEMDETQLLVLGQTLM